MPWKACMSRSSLARAAISRSKSSLLIPEGFQIRPALLHFIGRKVQRIVIEDLFLPGVPISDHGDTNGFQCFDGITSEFRKDRPWVLVCGPAGLVETGERLGSEGLFILGD